MNKSKIRNRYQKWPSKENVLALKEAKKLCNKSATSVKKAYFRKITGKSFANNMAFWITVKPFLLTKVFLQMKSLLQKTKGKL